MGGGPDLNYCNGYAMYIHSSEAIGTVSTSGGPNASYPYAAQCFAFRKVPMQS